MIPKFQYLTFSTLALAVVSLTSCAPHITDPNPRAVSSWALLTRPKDLRMYLDSRYAKLDELRGKIAGLDSRLETEMANLQRKRRALDAVQAAHQGSAADRQRAEAALAAQEAHANRILGRTVELQSQVKTMSAKRDLAATEAEAESARVNHIKSVEIPQLKTDIDSLQRGVDRGLQRSQDEIHNH